MSLELAGRRRAPIEVHLCHERCEPKSVRLCGMRIILSIHRVNPGKLVLPQARLRTSSYAESLVYGDMAVDLDDDVDEWVRWT